MLEPLKEASAEETAQALLRIYSVIGPPRIVSTDAGSNFRNHLMEAFNALCGIFARVITAYHAQSNGKVERNESNHSTSNE